MENFYKPVVNLNYELPHPLDRFKQHETCEEILKALETHRVVIVEGPTGVGKTALIAAISLFYRVMSLTFTKSLQDQYSLKYGFKSLFGLGSYPCGKHSKASTATCNDLYNGQRPCADIASSFINGCKYSKAKRIAIESDRMVTNVSKFLVDRSILEKHHPDIVAIDECHLLSDFLIGYAGKTLKWDTEFYTVKAQKFHSVNDDRDRVRLILKDMHAQLIENIPNPPTSETDFQGLKLIKKWNELLSGITYLMDDSMTNYFFEGKQDELVIKPLSPKNLFQRMVLGGGTRKVILMSATPGNPEKLAETFGLSDDQWTYVCGDDGLNPADKKIKVLKAPRMTSLYVPNWLRGEKRKQKEIEVERKKSKQAKVIADEINSYPEWYQGLITVTSYAMADDLSARLRSHGIETFVPSRGIGTSGQLKEALTKLDMKTSINSGQKKLYRAVISCTFNEGVDFGGLQFVIVAKVPYPYIGDKYSKVRKEFDPNWYLMTTASTMRQALGRANRERAHFLPGADKVVVIADSSYTGVVPYCEESFKQRLVLPKSNVIQPRKGRKLSFKGIR